MEITTESVEALVGRGLTVKAAKVITWLNGLDDYTISAVMSLLEAPHRFGYIAGEKDYK
ncbi:hypothetical protein [Paenibacillus sp. SI8]|uniref:hypothetical protein n=1 Tax=unclassified Paenibacillus TaxID=185978 RepID=UPI003466A026